MAKHVLALAVCLALLAACGESHEMMDAQVLDAEYDAQRLDGADPRDAGVAADAADAGSDAPIVDAGRDAGPRACGSGVCAPGQDCCFTTLTCFDPADPSACTAAHPGSCAASSECPPGQWCYATSCGGEGTCRDVQSCMSPEPTCGCDGVTYRNVCAAEAAGVRYLVRGRGCGVAGAPGTFIGCGVATPCPTDTGTALTCCPITGLCIPADDPGLCVEPSSDGGWPCRSNSQCPENSYCEAPACGAVGQCNGTGVFCDGSLVPVCGCDGTSYTNACWAQRAGVSVDHAGECP